MKIAAFVIWFFVLGSLGLMGRDVMRGYVHYKGRHAVKPTTIVRVEHPDRFWNDLAGRATLLAMYAVVGGVLYWGSGLSRRLDPMAGE